MSRVIMGNDTRCPCECESLCVLNEDLDHAEHRTKQLEHMLEQCHTALAAILCADEPNCPTEREAKRLCVAAMQKLNTNQK